MSAHTGTDGASRLESLEPLVGDWDLGDDTSGTVTYAWLPGKQFLVQHFDLVLQDHRVTGLEVIGHLRPYGQEATPEIWSRAYDDAGNTLDYVYELEGRTLTIWAGGPGSPAFYRGTFSPDGRSSTGAWTYPGGGYRSSMTRRDG